MRVLGITETCDLGSLYMRLLAEGHDVRVSVSEPLAEGTMAGFVPRTADWRAELGWIREAAADGVIIFEAVGFGELQDQLRRDGFNVIGGSALGDKLENDRAFAFELLARHGLNIAPVCEFGSAGDAIANLEARPRRCVFKLCASAGDTFVGALDDGSDIAGLLDVRPPPGGERFILMDHVTGVETGVGAYFNGQRFLQPACLDWEHKRFFAGNMGEQTGEMGTVATFTGSARLFDATLAPLEPMLREAGHVGWVNLNTIINDQGVWPLEFTCRFGYPGFAILTPLQETAWGDLFAAMVSRSTSGFATRPGFSVGIVLTLPPFPYPRPQVEEPVGLPVLFDGELTDADRTNLHYCELGLENGELVTSGMYGWAMVVTGVGDSIASAQQRANSLADRVLIPNVRYRRDIGDRLMAGDYARVEKLRLLDATAYGAESV